MASRFWVALLMVSQAVAAEFSVRFDVPAQSLADAVKQVAEQSNTNIFLDADIQKRIENRQSMALQGMLTVDEALTKLLQGSGVRHQFTNEHTVVLEAEGAAAVVNRQRLTVAQAATDESAQHEPQSRAATESSAQEGEKLEEIVVTAQKRSERLIDVPQAVSVVSADALTRAGAFQFRDFADTVPGLNFETQGAGRTRISLRGVTVGRDVSPTVGIYVDEVPYGSGSSFSSGVQFAPDVALFDVDRIEILRGPQGTLYGSSTMGGLVKYVTKQPHTSRFSADAQTGIGATQEGGVSYNGALAVNAPIKAEKLGLRASGFYSHDGGYIDNVALGENDVNRSNIYGGRVDLLFTPTDSLNIRLTGFLQNIARDGEGTVDYAITGSPPVTGVPFDGPLDQRRLLPEPFNQRFRLVSGTLNYDIGPAMLTSVSSYQTIRTDVIFDTSRTDLFFCSLVGRTCSAIGLLNAIATDKFVQEVRLAANGSRPLGWVIGGFYSHETSRLLAEYHQVDVAGQPAPNDLANTFTPSLFDEYAAFGDLTWRLSDKVDVTGGLRYARNQQSFEGIGSGFFGPFFTHPRARLSDSVFTYLANARYHFNRRSLGYLRYATGYRPGGPNFPVIDSSTGVPVERQGFEADRLKSYEIGYRFENADRRLAMDLAAYYIDWSNIQVVTVIDGFSATANAPGGATSQGAELAFTVRPVRGFAATSAFTYQDAKMSENESSLGASKGERLPGVPRVMASLNADYELPLVQSLQPTLGATLRYVDGRMASFDGNFAQQYHLPGYSTVDLRIGITLGRTGLQLYARNVFDRRGELSAFNWRGDAQPSLVQPRTVGLTASAKF